MKKYIALLLFHSFFFLSYSQDLFCSKIDKIIKVAQKHHINRTEINTEFQLLVENIFFENLDPYQLLFTAEDLTELKHTHDLIRRNCDWIDKISDKISQNLPLINEMLAQQENIEIDFNIEEQFEIPDSASRVKRSEFKNHWKKYLKYRILNEVQIEVNSIPDPNLFKNEILKKLKCRTEKLNLGKNSLEDLYLQCITLAFDPHSFYLPSEKANLFLQELKGDNKSYGLVLSSNNDDVIVAKMIPGSSAWNSNEINEGDVILQFETPEGNNIDFSCLSHTECQEILHQQDGMITIEIKKANNLLKKVTIKKEVISQSEDNIQSYILKKKNKVAYIYLPSFYTGAEFDFLKPSGCAKDLAKELIRLKKENVEALILDLRNNGGGSMHEALHMAGIFIDYGSLIILEDREQEAKVIKDLNRGVVFDKPLIVLVNNFSASASEMLAGVLQDYNRALIVGSRTFGKSSSQVFYDLDGNLFEGTFDTKRDLLKLTTGLFYRVSSASHQQIGIRPNVVLPELFENANPKESDFPNALENKKSLKKIAFKALDETGIDPLEKKWNHLVLENEYFNMIVDLSNSNNWNQKEIGIPLNLNGYLKYSKTNQELFEELEQEDSNYFDQVSLSVNKQSAISADVFQVEENKKKLNLIAQDQYVIYSFQIIQEMINLNN